MATVRRTHPTRRTPIARAAAPAAPSLALATARRQIEYVQIDDIVPYPYNPRDNEKAIPQVAESIKNFGFLVPCVIDENNVLVAGHTRTEGAKLLGLTEVPCIRATGLTEEQINLFRLVDNKVSEAAEWNFDLLAGEFSKISGMGLDMTAFGWSQEEIDCLSEVVAADCLSGEDVLQEAQRTTTGNQNRRAPATARFVLGELVFFLPIADYRNWVDGVRQLHDFNETAIVEDLKRRLGIAQ